MSALHFVILGFACYRLARMVSEEAGPFWMFKYLRRLVKKDAPRKTHMDEGIECPLCMSMQFAILLVVADFYLQPNPLYENIILALALSGAAVALKQIEK